MAETSIEWTHQSGYIGVSWNPTRGCQRVSPGCGGAAGEGGCYAERQAARFAGPGGPYENLVRIGKQGPRWTGAARLVPEKLGEPLKWRKPRAVFVDSMSDLFYEGFTNEDIAAVFGVMAAAPQHRYLVLTKRARRMREWFAGHERDGARAEYDCVMAARAAGCEIGWPPVEADRVREPRWPLPNVWLGVSVEDQPRADERIPDLLACPAPVRWVSYEPALGAVDFRRWLPPSELCEECGERIRYEDDGPRHGTAWCACCVEGGEPCDPLGPRIDWIVVGGESGPGARPFDLAWARSVRDQCRAANVAWFCKQLGSRPVAHSCGNPACTHPDCGLESLVGPHDAKWGDITRFPADLRVRMMPGEEWGTELADAKQSMRLEVYVKHDAKCEAARAAMLGLEAR